MLSNKRRREYPKGPTEVMLLLDMSGSMQSRRAETIREVNNYLQGLRSDGQRYKITVVTFNEGHNFLISREAIKDVGQLEHSEYRPQGWTALLDAVGHVLESQQYRNGRRLFVVITDGQENASKRYTLQQVRNLIDRYRSEDFQFIFLGSGPDSWNVGANLGFNFSVATDYNCPENLPNIYKSLYTASNNMAKGLSSNTSTFTTGSTSALNTTPEK